MPSDERNPPTVFRPFTLADLDPPKHAPGPPPEKAPPPSKLVWLGFCAVAGGAAGLVGTALVKAIAAAFR
ncbi:MAG: hypothetical protein AB7O62_00190 [Pirellulales bacterium]